MKPVSLETKYMDLAKEAYKIYLCAYSHVICEDVKIVYHLITDLPELEDASIALGFYHGKNGKPPMSIREFADTVIGMVREVRD